jgi:hypothetical protein
MANYKEFNILVHDRIMHEMGVENNDWHPFIIDIDKIVAAKEFSWNDGEKNTRPATILYLEAQDFIVDESFDEIKHLLIIK